jgi:hypothetical protein
MNNDETSLRASPFGKLRVQPPLIVNRFDGVGAWGENQDSSKGESRGFSFKSKCHLSLGYRRGTGPVSLNGIVLIFSDSLSDGKPIQGVGRSRRGCLERLKPAHLLARRESSAKIRRHFPHTASGSKLK